MILNNYNAMTYVIENLDKEMNEDILIELHKIVTKETLSEDEVTKKYRKGPVYINDPNETKPVYVPPSAENVQPLMDDLFQFINDDSNDDKFIKPLIKAFIIHFYICYVHPFYDGNGRVARAFQYMYLLKNNYNFFKFFSVSGVISRDRKKYYKSFMDTEKYDSDLTYFIVTQMEMTLKAVKGVIDKMLKEIDNKLLKDELSKDSIILNKRQEKFLKYMVQKDNNFTTIANYKKKFKISYETARRDLFELNELNIVKKIKKGKKYIFIYQGVKGYIQE
jgi:Fic family protein